MALAFTVTSKRPAGGGLYRVVGTFTSASGDRTGSLTASDHGLNYIEDWKVDFGSAGYDIGSVKGTVSSGTISLVFSDTLGKSGRFVVIGS